MPIVKFRFLFLFTKNILFFGCCVRPVIPCSVIACIRSIQLNIAYMHIDYPTIRLSVTVFLGARAVEYALCM